MSIILQHKRTGLIKVFQDKAELQDFCLRTYNGRDLDTEDDYFAYEHCLEGTATINEMIVLLHDYELVKKGRK